MSPSWSKLKSPFSGLAALKVGRNIKLDWCAGKWIIFCLHMNVVINVFSFSVRNSGWQPYEDTAEQDWFLLLSSLSCSRWSRGTRWTASRSSLTRRPTSWSSWTSCSPELWCLARSEPPCTPSRSDSSFRQTQNRFQILSTKGCTC